MPPTKEDIIKQVDNRFTYHPPFGDQISRYADIRDAGKQLAHIIVEITPVSSEQSIALNLLDQAVMMANAAIARNEVQG